MALGDSYTCGEGVGFRVHQADTWARLLAHSLGLQAEVLARAGARVGHVRTEQLPVALSQRASISTVLAGLNDVIRTGWSDGRVTADLQHTVSALRKAGSVVVLARLHDATAPLPFRLPRRARVLVRHRLDVINAAVDSLAGPGVVILDLASVPELQQRSGWAVDRLHPGIAGHRAIAGSALRALSAIHVAAEVPPPAPVLVPVPGKLAEAIWFTRHGAPYLMRNAITQSAHVLQARLPVAWRATGSSCR